MSIGELSRLTGLVLRARLGPGQDHAHHQAPLKQLSSHITKNIQFLRGKTSSPYSPSRSQGKILQQRKKPGSRLPAPYNALKRRQAAAAVRHIRRLSGQPRKTIKDALPVPYIKPVLRPDIGEHLLNRSGKSASQAATCS